MQDSGKKERNNGDYLNEERKVKIKREKENYRRQKLH